MVTEHLATGAPWPQEHHGNRSTMVTGALGYRSTMATGASWQQEHYLKAFGVALLSVCLSLYLSVCLSPSPCCLWSSQLLLLHHVCLPVAMLLVMTTIY